MTVVFVPFDGSLIPERFSKGTFKDLSLDLGLSEATDVS